MAGHDFGQLAGSLSAIRPHVLCRQKCERLRLRGPFDRHRSGRTAMSRSALSKADFPFEVCTADHDARYAQLEDGFVKRPPTLRHE